jgi:hypothetical protein
VTNYIIAYKLIPVPPVPLLSTTWFVWGFFWYSSRIQRIQLSACSREWGRSWVRALVGSTQWLYNWYVLLLRYSRSTKKKEQILAGPWVHDRLFGGVRVAHLCIRLCLMLISWIIRWKLISENLPVIMLTTTVRICLCICILVIN